MITWPGVLGNFHQVFQDAIWCDADTTAVTVKNYDKLYYDGDDNGRGDTNEENALRNGLNSCLLASQTVPQNRLKGVGKHIAADSGRWVSTTIDDRSVRE